MLKTLLYRSLIVTLGWLPLGVLRVLGTALGNLAWLSRSRMWLVSKQNIHLCYPQLDEHRATGLAKQSLRETGKTLLETCYAWSRPTATVLKQIQQVNGQHQVDLAQAQGQGIIFVIPHLGNWEVINHFLGSRYGLTHMYQPNRYPALDRFIQGKRALTGTQFVATDRSGIKAQLKRIRSGGCIGVMPDQEPTVHTGQFVPFFGIPALTNELLAGYAKGNAAVFIAVCERSENGFEIHLNEVKNLTPDNTLPALNLAIETAVRRQPAQYLWSYKRFRTRPEGQLDFYHVGQHPIRKLLEALALSGYGRLFAGAPFAVAEQVAKLAVPWMRRRRKISNINLKLTNIDSRVGLPSLTHTALSAFEAPGIWRTPYETFQKRVQGLDQLQQLSGGAMVLIPPHGSREALIRCLAQDHQVTEYYHHHPIEALDEFIQQRRNGLGIRLAPHNQGGRQQLIDALQRQEVVTLCPDQQPRLRGGIFVDFFGHPALTTTAIPEILKASGAKLFLGYVLRAGRQFQLHLRAIQCPNHETANQTADETNHETNEALLNRITRDLEAAILEAPEQYRWSDKRYNIQPPGCKKVYR